MAPHPGGQPTPLVCGGGDDINEAQAVVVQIGAYRVEASEEFFLDRGTFGAVYRGSHEESAQYVAVLDVVIS